MKKFLRSFYYAGRGIKSAFKSERNMKVHTVMAILVIIMGFVLRVSFIEWCMLVFAIASVITAEIFNTSIEKTVDLISLEKTSLARQAKDLAAGAVLVSAIGSAIIGIIVFLPKLIELF